MQLLKRIFFIAIFLVSLSYNFIKAQNNPSNITILSPVTLSADETKRATQSILLQPGFKYGAGNAGSRLTLQISSYPSYVESGYQEFSTACNYPASNNPLVGEVEGKFSVSLSGSSVYQIPIKMSPGTGGMQPNLSLIYSSGNGSSTMGLGWNLSGLSAISRVNKTPYLDTKYEEVKLSTSDVFALDGNRLVLKTGTYGTSNSTYGTELESFASITAVGQQGNGPQYFVVVDQNGNTSEYGNVVSTDPKLTGIGDNTPLIWYINKMKDIYGNYIEFFYKQLNGEVVIDRIEYTKNAGSSSPDYNEIKFDYITKTEKKITYVGDKEFRSTQLLKSITAKANGNLVKSYILNYQFSFNTILSDVTEVNQDGTEVKATGFCYNDPYYNSVAQYASQNTDLYATASDYTGIKTVIPADLNGDGFSDAVVVKPIVNISNPNNKFEARRNDYPSGSLTGGTIGFSQMQLANSTGVTSNTILGAYTLDTDFDDRQEVYLVVNDASNNKKYHIQKILDVGTASVPDVQATTIKPNLTLVNAINLTQTPTKFYYDVSDYNGDGINDELIIDPETITINSSLGNKSFQISSPNTSVARPFDFDGDGYLEVVLFKNSNANNTNLFIDVLKYTSSGLTSIATKNITFPTSAQDLLKLISIGDYNGDGKGDVLFLNETKQNLSIIYSTGSTFSASKPVNSFTGLNSSINYNIISPDINGDGSSDIIFTDNIGATSLQNYVSYYSMGDIFIKGFSAQGKFKEVFQSMKYYYTYKGAYNTISKTEKVRVNEYSIDFNGDGIFDVVSIDGTNTNTILNNSTSVKTQFLSRITTGLNKQIDITYANARTKFDNSHTRVYRDNSGSYSGSLISFTPSNYLVSLVQYRNTNLINLSQNERYFYQGAVFHKFGKGFLGFESSGMVNTNTLLGSISSFTPNATYQLADYTSIETGKFIASNAFNNITEYFFNGQTSGFDGRSSKTVTQYQITPTSSQSIFSAPSVIDSKDFLSSTASITNVTYDLSKNGNPTNKLVTHGWPGSGAGTGTIKTENTNIIYQNIGSIPYSFTGIFKPQSETYMSVQLPDLPYSRTTVYNYTGFKLTSVIQDPSGNSLTTTFSNHNVFGAAQLTEVMAGDIQTRRVESIYDQSGRFVIKTINVKGDVEEFMYEPKYGSLLQKKDISGLISKYTYDGLGRLIQSNLPDNTVNTITYDYTSQPSPDNVYSKTVNNEGSAYFTTFYNHLGDETGTKTEDVNGKTIVTDNKYDYNTGFLTQSSEPHFSSPPQATYLITKYTYEAIFSRLKKEEVFTLNSSSPNNPITTGLYTQYDYNPVSKDYSNGLFLYSKGSVTKTDQTNKKIVKTNNAAGQLDDVKNYEGYDAVIGLPSPIVGDYQITSYAYNSNGKPKSITLYSTLDPNPISHLFGYNLLAQQTQLIDPSAGTMNYTYNRLSEILHNDDANGSYDYTYDNLGRIETKTGSSSGLTSYDYVLGNDGKNQIEKITGPNVTTEFAYDALGRATSFKETITGGTPKIFTTLADYDKYSNVTKYTYPSGFITKYNYNVNGFLTTISDNSNNPIWQINNQNAIGQITNYDLGGSNGVTVLNSYTNLHYLSSIQYGNIHKQDYIFDPQKGNLLQRDFYNYTTSTHNREKFTFDGLDRLRESKQVDNQDNALYLNAVDIDEKGNITHKDDAGDYVYSNTAKPFNLTQINNPTPNISLNTLSTTYNDIRKVSILSEATTNKEMSFTYGNDDERVKVDYKINNVNQYTRYYQSDYEREESGTDAKEWTYIYAPTGLAAVVYKADNASSNQLLYALTDHLGSPVLLTNSSQQIEEEYSFDSWGRRRNPVDWTYTAAAPTILNRGYTFHEHIDEFNLINMNGRIYDPVLGRFVQPDNQVQYPDYLQTYNKYAYVFNNPLSYTDPSGWGGDSGSEDDDLLWGGGNGLSPAYSNYSDYNAAQNPSGVAWASGGGGGASGGWYSAGISGIKYEAMMDGKSGDWSYDNLTNTWTLTYQEAVYAGTFSHDFTYKGGTPHNIYKYETRTVEYNMDDYAEVESGVLNGAVSSTISPLYNTRAAAKASTVLLADDVFGVGAIDDVLIPVLFAGAAALDYYGISYTEAAQYNINIYAPGLFYIIYANYFSKGGKQGLWDDELSPLSREGLNAAREAARVARDTKTLGRIIKEEKRRGERNKQKRKK